MTNTLQIILASFALVVCVIAWLILGYDLLKSVIDIFHIKRFR